MTVFCLDIIIFAENSSPQNTSLTDFLCPQATTNMVFGERRSGEGRGGASSSLPLKNRAGPTEEEEEEEEECSKVVWEFCALICITGVGPSSSSSSLGRPSSSSSNSSNTLVRSKGVASALWRWGAPSSAHEKGSDEDFFSSFEEGGMPVVPSGEGFNQVALKMFQKYILFKNILCQK